MPLDVVLASPEQRFWSGSRRTGMRLKIRVRRMKEARELRGVYLGRSGGEPPLQPFKSYDSFS